MLVIYSLFSVLVGLWLFVGCVCCTYAPFQGMLMIFSSETCIVHPMNLFCWILQVFTFSQKISVNFQLLLRFIQGVSFLLAIAGLVAAIVITELTVADIFACVLAFVPTGWGILSVSISDNFILFILNGHIYLLRRTGSQ